MSSSAAPEFDARPLGWGRIALGSLFLLRTTPLLEPLGFDFAAYTFPLLGWPPREWQGAAVGMALPAWAIAAACIVRTLAAVCFLFGVRTRLAGLVACAAGYLVMLQSPFGLVATLHLLFQGTLVVALAGGGAAHALRPEPARHLASGLLLVRLYLGSIYLWAGGFKLRPDWLDGRTLALFHADGALRGPLADFVLSGPSRRSVVAWTIALTELSLPWLLLLRPTRRLAPFIALGLHASIELCASPDLLGWEMAALLLCLWPAGAQDHRPKSRKS